MELGSIRLFDRARRATPSELKLHDDENNVKKSKNQCHKAILIFILKSLPKSQHNYKCFCFYLTF
jgi:hypothetical protein